MLSVLTSNYNKVAIVLLTMLITMASCRDDEYVVYMEDSILPPTPPTTIPQEKPKKLCGMYVLCEGNMGSNKCTVDYLDFTNADGQTHYFRNIFASRNPSAVKELGDVGNDVKIYGSKMWMVINCSNKVEVCTADSCKRIGQVNIPNCRYITFDKGYAYVSSYVGPVQLGTTQIGRVYKVDTLSLQVVGMCDVGRQPEELEVMNGKIYVANSGGYTADNYDNTVSVIDAETMTEERRITVADNLHRLRKDSYGQLWVSARGDYYGNPSRIFCIKDDDITMIDAAVSEMCLVGDSLYYFGVSFSYITYENEVEMGIINVKTHEKVQTDIFSAPEMKQLQMPYGMMVNPVTRDFYIMDAMNYVSSGLLYHFAADGTFRWKQRTGDIPSRAAFLWK